MISSWCRKTIVLVTLTSSFFLDGNVYLLANNNLANNNASSYTKNIDTNPETLYQMSRYDEAIKKWLEMLDLTSNLDEKALIYNNLGIAYRQTGKISEAIAQWQQAIVIYQSQSPSQNQSQNSDRLTKLFIDQAQAYIALGQHQQAVLLLQKVATIASPENMQLVKGTLGNAYFALGKYEQAIAVYQESISLTNKPQILAKGWMNLGNAFTKSAQRYQAQIQVEIEEGDRPEVTRLQNLRSQSLAAARNAYARSLQPDSEAMLKAQVLLNLAHLIQADLDHEDDQDQKLTVYLQQASDFLAIAPPSRSKVYTLLDLAALHQQSSPSLQMRPLEQARAIAQSIGDLRSESFVLGAIGKVYEAQGDFTRALSFTSQAQWLAQTNNSADSLYRWQWQAGRILNARGERSKSIETYRQAIATLQSIRSDLVAADRGFQFDVRDTVEPVYRELIELLMTESISTSNLTNQKSMIEEALQVSELLRLSELQNFFGDECLQTKSTSKANLDRESQSLVKQSQQKVALIYSIILDQQTYIVIRLPDNSLKSYLVDVSKAKFYTKIKYLRFTLENVATNEYLTPAQEIYDLLIRPIEKDLERSQVELLVFVNDGILRTVPMAALYDGKQFLIQKYPISYLVGSKLPDETGSFSQLNLVAFGLSEAIAPFKALPNVLKELEEVEKIWESPINKKPEWKTFFNRDFTFESLQTQIKQGYGVVHLATHAKFGATPETTFLQAFDRKINLDQLESILRSSRTQIELLVLSACQTAAGDNRSILGLAGVSLRSGVKNVLATLWAVDDADVVPLIKDFYTEWQTNGLTKAKALQQAQIKSITKDNFHPASWSAFILVGN